MFDWAYQINTWADWSVLFLKSCWINKLYNPPHYQLFWSVHFKIKPVSIQLNRKKYNSISISDKLASHQSLYTAVPLLPRCSETSVPWVRNRGRGQRSDAGACSWRRCVTQSTCLHRTSSCRRTTDDCEKVSACPPSRCSQVKCEGNIKRWLMRSKTPLIYCSPGGDKGCSKRKLKDWTITSKIMKNRLKIFTLQWV